MIFSFLASIVVSAAASITVGGLEVTENNHVWASVVSNPGTATASLDVFESEDFTEGFGTPVLTIDPEDRAVIGGVLKSDGNGNIHLFYTLTKGYYDGEGEIYMRSCPVDAPTRWSDPVKVGTGCVHSAPVMMSDGNIALPVSIWGPYCTDPAYAACVSGVTPGALVYLSSDKGASWTASEVVNVPERRFAAYNNPSLIQTPEGTLKMISRSCDTGFSYACESNDGGHTWSIPVRFVQTPDRNFSAVNVDGSKVLYIKNFKLDMIQYYSCRELYALFSDDGGVSWYGDLKITDEDFVQDPVAAQCPDGRILVAWSRKYKENSTIRIAEIQDGKVGEPAVAFEAGDAEKAYNESIAPMMTPRTDYGKKSVRLGCYNIQRQGAGSGPSWKNRSQAVIQEFIEHKWDIVATQEAKPEYIDEIIEATGDVYAYFADTREFMGDKYRSGSENPVIYRKARFQLKEYGVIEYAINQEHFVGARSNKESYGAEYHKSTVWGRFYDKLNDMEFLLVNVHGPVRSVPAQEAEAQIMLDSIMVLSKGIPVILAGDFNSNETSQAYHYLTDCDWLEDSMTSLPESKRKNWEYSSFCGYNPVEKFYKSCRHLDHVFYTPASVRIKSWWLDIYATYEGKYASDHLSLTVEFNYANR